MLLRTCIVDSMESSISATPLPSKGLTENGNVDTSKSEDARPEDGLGDYEVLAGAQISENFVFKSKKGKTISVTPIIVDFRRLIQSRAAIDVVPGVTNRELLHAVAALYDISLSEMTPDVLYSAICEKWGRTVILLRDIKDTLEDLEEKKLATKAKGVEEKDIDDTISEENNKEVKNDEDDVYVAEEETPSTFAEVFSDTDEEEEESDEEEEEDFSQGIQSFLKIVKLRRQMRLKHEGPLTPEHVGIENRLVAAGTFEKTYCKPNERVVHLTLIAVRPRYRKWGIGKYLLHQLKDTSVVGMYDAIVVHADNSAVEFFERYGFTDDIVLNSRWSELAEQYTNCTLMSFLPPFTAQTITKDSHPELDIIAMEKEIKKWREKSMDAYRAEVSCMDRMRQEIIHLRALASSQQDLISSITADNQKLTHEKFLIEKEFLEYRFSTTRAAFNGIQSDDDEDDVSAEQLIRQLEDEVDRGINRKASLSSGVYQRRDSNARMYLVSSGSGKSDEPYDHGKDAEEFFKATREFYAAMKLDSSIITSFEMKMVSKSMLTTEVEENYLNRIPILKDSKMVTKLYFCGTLMRPQCIENILVNGFQEEDFTQSQYGKGLHFSKYPSKAAQFSALGKLVVAEVGLGATETVIAKDPSRVAPTDGFDSILTPGRLVASGDNDVMLSQEYVIFDINQVKPLYLLEYSPVYKK